MKSTFLKLVTIVILSISLSTSLVVHASETTKIITEDEHQAERGYRSTSGYMYGGGTIYPELTNVGSSPTFSFTISGAPSLYVDVLATSPTGNTFTLFSNIRCNGGSHTKYHFCLLTGTYFFTIVVNHGTSSGETKPYTISATW